MWTFLLCLGCKGGIIPIDLTMFLLSIVLLLMCQVLQLQLALQAAAEQLQMQSAGATHRGPMPASPSPSGDAAGQDQSAAAGATATAAPTTTALSAAAGQPTPATTPGAGPGAQLQDSKTTTVKGPSLNRACKLRILRASVVKDVQELNTTVALGLKDHLPLRNGLDIVQMPICSSSPFGSYLATLAGLAAADVDIYTVVSIWGRLTQEEQQQEAFMQACLAAAESHSDGTRAWCSTTSMLQLHRPTLVFRVARGVTAMTDIGLSDAVLLAVPSMPCLGLRDMGAFNSDALHAVYRMAGAGVCWGSCFHAMVVSFIHSLLHL